MVILHTPTIRQSRMPNHSIQQEFHIGKVELYKTRFFCAQKNMPQNTEPKQVYETYDNVENFCCPCAIDENHEGGCLATCSTAFCPCFPFGTLSEWTEASLEYPHPSSSMKWSIVYLICMIPLYSTTASQRWRSAASSRFIDVTASCECVCSAQKTLMQGFSPSAHAVVLYTMVLMTVISCRQRVKPVVSMSTSSSSLRRAARTFCLYARFAGPHGNQA